MNTANQEDRNKKPDLIHKCWAYLADNFHKFSEDKQIKIALELCKKDQPTKLEGGLNFTKMPTALVDGKPLEANIGTSNT